MSSKFWKYFKSKCDLSSRDLWKAERMQFFFSGKKNATELQANFLTINFAKKYKKEQQQKVCFEVGCLTQKIDIGKLKAEV